MSNGRNGEQSTPVLLFSAAVMIALLAVTVMTFERGYTRTASYEPPPGVTVPVKPHPHLHPVQATERLLSGARRTCQLKRPVNYALARVAAPSGVEIDGGAPDETGVLPFRDRQGKSVAGSHRCAVTAEAVVDAQGEHVHVLADPVVE